MTANVIILPSEVLDIVHDLLLSDVIRGEGEVENLRYEVRRCCRDMSTILVFQPRSSLPVVASFSFRHASASSLVALTRVSSLMSIREE